MVIYLALGYIFPILLMPFYMELVLPSERTKKNVSEQKKLRWSLRLYVNLDSMYANFWTFCTGNLMMHGFTEGVSEEVS